MGEAYFLGRKDGEESGAGGVKMARQGAGFTTRMRADPITATATANDSDSATGAATGRHCERITQMATQIPPGMATSKSPPERSGAGE